MNAPTVTMYDLKNEKDIKELHRVFDSYTCERLEEEFGSEYVAMVIENDYETFGDCPIRPSSQWEIIEEDCEIIIAVRKK